MPKRDMPDGGRYTRPRRGFRAKSHYRDRLRKRGVSRHNVRMETIDALRKRQGYIPRSPNGADSAERAYTEIREADAGLQMSTVRQMAFDDMEDLPGNEANHYQEYPSVE